MKRSALRALSISGAEPYPAAVAKLRHSKETPDAPLSGEDTLDLDGLGVGHVLQRLKGDRIGNFHRRNQRDGGNDFGMEPYDMSAVFRRQGKGEVDGERLQSAVSRMASMVL